MNSKKTQSLVRLFFENKKQTFTGPKNKIKYYFIIASQNFLLKEEPLEEVLRERFQYCYREKKPMNFWLIKSPKFLDSPAMVKLRNKLPNDSVAIISTNESFIRWLKLRYHHVGIGSFVAPSPNIVSPLESKIKIL